MFKDSRENTTRATKTKLIAALRQSVSRVNTKPNGEAPKNLLQSDAREMQQVLGRYGAQGIAHVLLGHLIEMVNEQKLPRYWFAALSGIEHIHPCQRLTRWQISNCIQTGKFSGEPKKLLSAFGVAFPSVTSLTAFSFHDRDYYNLDYLPSPLDDQSRVEKRYSSFFGPPMLGWTHQHYVVALLEKQFNSADELFTATTARDTKKLGVEMLLVMSTYLEETTNLITPATATYIRDYLLYWQRCAESLFSTDQPLGQLRAPQ